MVKSRVIILWVIGSLILIGGIMYLVFFPFGQSQQGVLCDVVCSFEESGLLKKAFLSFRNCGC